MANGGCQSVGCVYLDEPSPQSTELAKVIAGNTLSTPFHIQDFMLAVEAQRLITFELQEQQQQEQQHEKNNQAQITNVVWQFRLPSWQRPEPPDDKMNTSLAMLKSIRVHRGDCNEAM